MFVQAKTSFSKTHVVHATEDYSLLMDVARLKLIRRIELASRDRSSPSRLRLSAGIVHNPQKTILTSPLLLIFGQGYRPPGSWKLVGTRFIYTEQLVLSQNLLCVSRYRHLREGCYKMCGAA